MTKFSVRMIYLPEKQAQTALITRMQIRSKTPIFVPDATTHIL